MSFPYGRNIDENLALLLYKEISFDLRLKFPSFVILSFVYLLVETALLIRGLDNKDKEDEPLSFIAKM